MYFSPIFVGTVMVFLTSPVTGLAEDYYWREYTGTVPHDAIIGGQNIDGDNIYIGQAPAFNFSAAYPVEIHAGVKTVQVPVNDTVQEIKNYAKILCGLQEDFHWVSANASHLHLIMVGQHPVIGGYSLGYGYYYIGRIGYQEGIKIARVVASDIGKARLYFNDDKKVRISNTFEVLVYDNNLSLVELIK